MIHKSDKRGYLQGGGSGIEQEELEGKSDGRTVLLKDRIFLYRKEDGDKRPIHQPVTAKKKLVDPNESFFWSLFAPRPETDPPTPSSFLDLLFVLIMRERV